MVSLLKNFHLRELKVSASVLVSQFHTSCVVTGKPKFPFVYVKPPKESIIYKSGDKEGLKEIDLSRPKWEFRNSKELETADETVKKIFSLDFAPRRNVIDVLREEMVAPVRKHELDIGSYEARIAKMTVEIRQLQCAMRKYKKSVKKGQLKELIDKRNKYFRKLRAADSERFEWLLKTLNVTYFPPPEYHYRVEFNKGVKEMAQKYCEDMRIAKLQAYKTKLKDMQKEFEKEREEKLKFIAEEEKDLGLTDAQVIEFLDPEVTKPQPLPVQSTLLQIARKTNNTEETALKYRPPQPETIPY